MTSVVAIIPALDEEACIADVVRGIAAFVDRVIVVDNGSRDATASRARAAGATVVDEPRRGYGAACLAGIAAADDASVLLFMDADGSDDPADAPALLRPIVEQTRELTLGVRTRATTEEGAMTTTQQFGNWLAPLLMRTIFGANFHDMPPFKAIRADALRALGVTDRGHGFTIELLLAAHAHGLSFQEIPVRCRRRAGGESKVSGTVAGTLRASAKILTTLARHRARAVRPADRAAARGRS